MNREGKWRESTIFVYIVFKKKIFKCTYTYKREYGYEGESAQERMRMREKAFVQYLFTATSISKYRKRSSMQTISENKNSSGRRRGILYKIWT